MSGIKILLYSLAGGNLALAGINAYFAAHGHVFNGIVVVVNLAAVTYGVRVARSLA